jgi:hypothetical protein
MAASVVSLPFPCDVILEVYAHQPQEPCVACPARVTDNLIQQPAMAACDVSQPLSVDTLLTAPPLGCDVLTVLSLLFAFLLPQGYNSCVLLHVLSCVRRQRLADQSLPKQLIPTGRCFDCARGCSVLQLCISESCGVCAGGMSIGCKAGSACLCCAVWMSLSFVVVAERQGCDSCRLADQV